MKLAIVDTVVSTHPVGGVHRFTVDLALGLVPHFESVSLVTTLGSRLAELDRETSPNVELVVEGRDFSRRLLLEHRATAFARQLATATHVVLANSPDVGWLCLPHLGVETCKVAVLHNDVDAYYEPAAYYHTELQLVVGVSAHICRMFRTMVSGIEVREIPYGVPIPTAPRSIGGIFRIAFMGRLEHGQKHAERLVSLARELSERGTAYRLEVIGDGEKRSALARELVDTATFHGWCERDRVAEILRTCAVIVSFSDHEGLPIALLEAMSHGVVPVVSNIRSGHPQLVEHGTSGYLVDDGSDVYTYAEHIDRLARAPETLAVMSQKAFDAAANRYSTEMMIDSFRDALFHLKPNLERRELMLPMPRARPRAPRGLRALRELMRRKGLK